MTNSSHNQPIGWWWRPLPAMRHKTSRRFRFVLGILLVDPNETFGPETAECHRHRLRSASCARRVRCSRSRASSRGRRGQTPRGVRVPPIDIAKVAAKAGFLEAQATRVPPPALRLGEKPSNSPRRGRNLSGRGEHPELLLLKEGLPARTRPEPPREPPIA